MPRRASSGISIGQILGIGGALLGFLVAAVLLVKVVGSDLFSGGGSKLGPGSKEFANASDLQLDTYIDDGNGNSLRGNVYKVSGRVEEILKYTPDRGRLITITANGAGNQAPLPVLVPESFNGVNIDRGSEFNFVVRVDRGGILIAEAVEPG